MSAAPSDKPVEPTPAPAPPAAPDRPPRGPAPRVLLAVSAVLFFGWLAWLGYTALTKSREPIVSRAQAATATVPVRATVDADDKGAPAAIVTVVEPLAPAGPAANAKLMVANLPTARGFTGKGEYLLLLAPDHHVLAPNGSTVYQLVAARTSAPESDTPSIYPWSADVAAQAKRLYRGK